LTLFEVDSLMIDFFIKICYTLRMKYDINKVAKNKNLRPRADPPLVEKTNGSKTVPNHHDFRGAISGFPGSFCEGGLRDRHRLRRRRGVLGWPMRPPAVFQVGSNPEKQGSPPSNAP